LRDGDFVELNRTVQSLAARAAASIQQRGIASPPRALVHGPSKRRVIKKELFMMKAKTVAMIGALLLGSSALALAQTGSSSTMSPSSGAGTGSSAGSTMGGTSGSNTGTTTRSVTGGTTGSTTGGTGSMTGGGPTGATSGSTAGSATTTAPGPQSAMRSDQDVTKRLQDAGYSNVSDVKPGKNGYTASAMKNGKRVRVAVDANGKIQAMN
jgi:hypothetical protein